MYLKKPQRGPWWGKLAGNVLILALALAFILLSHVLVR